MLLQSKKKLGRMQSSPIGFRFISMAHVTHTAKNENLAKELMKICNQICT